MQTKTCPNSKNAILTAFTVVVQRNLYNFRLKFLLSSQLKVPAIFVWLVRGRCKVHAPRRNENKTGN
jgi:hypothetical protein